MNLLEEIRSQPAHIREVFMWLCVIITFSAVSFFWFQSTAKEFVALVNPQKAEQDRIFAEQNKTVQPSLFATIGSSFSTMRASFSELVGIGKGETIQFTNYYRNNPVPPNLFPASRNK